MKNVVLKQKIHFVQNIQNNYVKFINNLINNNLISYFVFKINTKSFEKIIFNTKNFIMY